MWKECRRTEETDITLYVIPVLPRYFIEKMWGGITIVLKIGFPIELIYTLGFKGTLLKMMNSMNILYQAWSIFSKDICHHGFGDSYYFNLIRSATQTSQCEKKYWWNIMAKMFIWPILKWTIFRKYGYQYHR